MRKTIIACAALMATALGMSAQKIMKAPQGGTPISDNLIGIFFEDISSSADGGLYAELVQNGSFEYSPTERDGWGAGTAWRFVRPGHSLGYMEPRMNDGLNANNPTYMHLHAERTREFYDYAGFRGVGMENSGFNGISVKAGAKYDFSVFVRDGVCDGIADSQTKGKAGALTGKQAKSLRVMLCVPQGWGKDPVLLADDTITIDGTGWKQYKAELTPNADNEKAALQLLLLDTGDVDIDMVSLMPSDTYKGHGLRKDLAEALEALHPRFMRFPGGCVVHGGGDGFWNTYRWKNTIGPKEQRKGLKNTWGYHQSMGLGYYEYFQLCEDLQMEPLPILPCGVSCQGTNGGWGMKDQAQDVVPMEAMDEWVQDALDLIEWANGDPTTSVWAKKRAEAGHPAPFNLKYLGLGNEEKITPEFCERFRYIYNKVMKAYPDIIIVGTAGPGSHPDNPDLVNGWKLAEELGMPLIDEHYYEKRDYFLTSRQYDAYPRDRKTKVYLGEYAAKDKKLIDALAEAIYLLHVERNGDVVTMTSYAPLFAKKDATNWNPDLIYFDNELTYPTCSYYVQQMFGTSAGQYYYGDCVNIADTTNLQGQSVILNVKTRKLFVKMCNASGDSKEATIDLSRFPLKKKMVKTVLQGKPEDENNYEQQPVKPETQVMKAKKKSKMTLPPYSFTMLEVSL